MSGYYQSNQGSRPTVDTLEKIREAFGITLSEFFESDEKKAHVSKEELELLNKHRYSPYLLTRY